MSLVSLVRTKNSSDLKRCIEKSLDLVNFSPNTDIHKIAIKPNMCYYWDYSTGETTSAQFVAELIDLLRNHTSDPEICIVESDASAMKCKYAFRMLGYEKMARNKDVKLVNLSKGLGHESKVRIADEFYNFSIPDEIKNADLFVNVPKIKYVPGTEISCALKNIYGCNPYPKKSKLHTFLDEAIIGLNKLMKPDLCLVDGVIVRGNCTKRLGLIMGGTDPVAVDWVAAKIAGMNPKRIRHIVLAEKEGLGTRQYQTVGEDMRYFADRFPRKSAKEKIMPRIIQFGSSVFRKLKQK